MNCLPPRVFAAEPKNCIFLFQDRRIRPLCHLSALSGNYFTTVAHGCAQPNLNRKGDCGILVGMTRILAVLLLLTNAVNAETHEEFGLRFWKALSGADLKAMESCYAPQVTLLAGSELLKKDWGINADGNRGKDLTLPREVLLKGYEALLAKIGIEKWKNIFGKLGREKIMFAMANKDGQTFKAVRRGDVLMKVATGPGDDALVFVLAQAADKSWSVRLEATDY